MPDLLVWDPTDEFLEFIQKSDYSIEKVIDKRCRVVDGYTESYEIVSQIVVRNYALNSFKGIIGVSAIFDGEPLEYVNHLS